jgi:hypothetical protein
MLWALSNLSILSSFSWRVCLLGMFVYAKACCVTPSYRLEILFYNAGLRAITVIIIKLNNSTRVSVYFGVNLNTVVT